MWTSLMKCCDPRSIVAAAAVCLALSSTLRAAPPSAEELEFFENRIRPVLVEHCYECHNSVKKAKGGLSVDHAAAIAKGGDTGPLLNAADPDRSLLLRVIRHEVDDLKMPKGGPKLAPEVIADFERWVKLGAPDPRDKAPTAEDLAAATSWENTFERRRHWWSFVPVHKVAAPEVANEAWAQHPIDRFVDAKLAAAHVTPADVADRRTLIRRLSYGLIGLPPTSEQIDAFVNDPAPDAYERLVDRLLADPRFGERWTRHWMDWYRYAESHGSEGDPAIPEAWRYRDYLIRALNADVPYDQLVREQIAGDLLPEPRINRELGVNESAIGVAQYRFVYHGFAPVDALDEQVRFTDNQIDVISKAVLGVTVSCARCHNHKFDAISQSDFYALYGVFASCRPAMITIDTPDRFADSKTTLARLKGDIRRGLADAWLASLDGVAKGLFDERAAPWQGAMKAAAKDPSDPLWAWTQLRDKSGDAWGKAWTSVHERYEQSVEDLAAQHAVSGAWRLGTDDADAWHTDGVGLDGRARAGEFSVLPVGDRAITDVYPAGVYTHGLSTKLNGLLTSPRFEVDMQRIFVRVAGDGESIARYAMQNYPRSGTVYPVQYNKGGALRWVSWDMSYWKGDHAYLEFATAKDTPVLVKNQDRSWFGVTDVVMTHEGDPAPRDEMAEFVAPLFEVDAADAPRSAETLAQRYVAALRVCVEGFKRNEMTDAQARFLGAFVRAGLLPSRLADLGDVSKLVAAYRDAEKGVPVPTRSPGVVEGDAFDQPLFVRGNHKQPGEPVRRRFLEAFGGKPYGKESSGRLGLARDLTDPANPLTSRVIVNRIWHHLFGRGIVATTDNFGKLGERPTHPELLDYLASRFVERGWSIKDMIRFMVTSRTYRLGSQAPAGIATTDPNNRLLSHFPVQRLDAEAIRDAILAVSGQLSDQMYGPSVPGGSTRRSVYVAVRRNDLDDFLKAFDAPEPNSTQGRRPSTNVPAQALMLLNDGFVTDRANAWANGMFNASGLTDEQRIERMFVAAVGRSPSEDEMLRCLTFVRGGGARDAKAQLELAAVRKELNATEAEIDAIVAPVRTRLLAERGTRQPAVDAAAPQPIARWEFDGDARDAIGGLHGTLRGKARIDSGELVVDGGDSYVETAPLDRTLTAKTLEAWVRLDNLGQRGGGVMSLQTDGGDMFDAIVFGEKDPRQWMAGSDFFRRTESFNGEPEADATSRLVHVAIVYHADGTVVGYRDGRRYGAAYRSKGPLTFEPGKSQVLFGLRHGNPSGNRMLSGRIARACLYDRALSDDEVARSAAAAGTGVTHEQVLAALDADQRRHVERLASARDTLRGRLTAAQAVASETGDTRTAWRDLALAIFNLKEFIYLR
ncbi:MAG: DUF1553 domain-containing protein [Phycisphaera sp.]|nr:DUF1553 domain-containing protein [Phycisphaera sp.]